MQLFKETEAPGKLPASIKALHCKWFTWSDSFREKIPDLKQQLKRAKTVDFVFLKKYKDYNYTYHVNLDKLDPRFMREFIPYARYLLKFNPGKQIYFFRDLIDAELNGKLFHFIISLLRAAIVKLTRNETQALYSPLTAGKNENDFPLHCDLYIPKILFNVFEKVPDNPSSGASLFVETGVLFNKVIPSFPMPKDKKAKLRSFVYGNRAKDNYDEFYSILYGEQYPWADKLKKALHKHKLRIKLWKGQGYMLNDTVWMHGRDKTTGGVSSKRLHRLIFNNATA